jgi:Cu/Ag efflux pump CusA
LHCLDHISPIFKAHSNPPAISASKDGKLRRSTPGELIVEEARWMHFALTVRLAPQYRDNVDAIRTVPVAVPNADAKSPTTYISLRDIAEVNLENGASYIYRENSQRFIPLKYSVRGRDLGSTVAQAQRHLAQTVPLPQAYRIEWTGEYGAMVEAQKRLAFIVPLSLLLIMICCSMACSTLYGTV